jgi:integrase/recombinase XerD
MSSKQSARPDLSAEAQQVFDHYEHHLLQASDLSPVSIRNYLSDIRLFMAWCERSWSEGGEVQPIFSLERIATPTITRYRDYLQHDLGRKPATINRYLVSIKRFFNWALNNELLLRDPAQVIKLVAQAPRPPRHLTDQEESRLIATVQASNNLRDITLITLMLHTGLRVREVCDLKWQDVVCGERSGHVRVWGKSNKYREVPLNSTVRHTLQEFEDNLVVKPEALFPSRRTGESLTPRALGFLIKKYAQRAGIPDLRPHDLRHRFGYRMAEKVPLHRLAQIMGHDSLDTTLIYIQGTQNDLQQAVERIAWE